MPRTHFAHSLDLTCLVRWIRKEKGQPIGVVLDESTTLWGNLSFFSRRPASSPYLHLHLCVDRVRDRIRSPIPLRPARSSLMHECNAMLPTSLKRLQCCSQPGRVQSDDQWLGFSAGSTQAEMLYLWYSCLLRTCLANQRSHCKARESMKCSTMCVGQNGPKAELGEMRQGG